VCTDNILHVIFTTTYFTLFHLCKLKIYIIWIIYIYVVSCWIYSCINKEKSITNACFFIFYLMEMVFMQRLHAYDIANQTRGASHIPHMPMQDFNICDYMRLSQTMGSFTVFTYIYEGETSHYWNIWTKIFILYIVLITLYDWRKIMDAHFMNALLTQPDTRFSCISSINIIVWLNEKL
jgi:hypothetical protein